jgi:hypothetical protein
MPTLDVNDAFDPSFIDFITVYRITQTIDKNGRVVRFRRAFTNVQAVVTATSPDDLQRLPDYEMMNKSISVYCPEFRLQGPVRSGGNGVLQTQPDEIYWHGSTFVVHSMQDYSGYGRGFTSAIAVSIDAVDAPPLGGSVGSA